MLIGTNAALSAANLGSAGRRVSSPFPVTGIFTGIGQVVYGVALMDKGDGLTGASDHNEGQKVLSLVNIGVGAATLITSIYNLTTRPARERRNSYGLYSAPLPGGQAVVGLRFVRRF